MNFLEKCRSDSDKALSALREHLAKEKLKENLCIVANGSLARGEFSTQSDVDFFVCKDGRLAKETEGRIESAVADGLKAINARPPAQGGAFSEFVDKSSLTEKIGGKTETNDALTRRMLTLLESKHLHGEILLNSIKCEIIDAYVKNISDSMLARFLLNDIIRYYRTICIDFEEKTRGGKSWGDRNIKLVFSRKLLYVSGIVAVFESVKADRDAVKASLLSQFDLTPIDRLRLAFGGIADIEKRYAYFLEQISEQSVRDELKKIKNPEESHRSDVFVDLKCKGKEFSTVLAGLLQQKYGGSGLMEAVIV